MYSPRLNVSSAMEYSKSRGVIGTFIMQKRGGRQKLLFGGNQKYLLPPTHTHKKLQKLMTNLQNRYILLKVQKASLPPFQPRNPVIHLRPTLETQFYERNTSPGDEPQFRRFLPSCSFCVSFACSLVLLGSHFYKCNLTRLCSNMEYVAFPLCQQNKELEFSSAYNSTGATPQLYCSAGRRPWVC